MPGPALAGPFAWRTAGVYRLTKARLITSR